MSTHCVSSAVFPLSIDQVWSSIRSFDFPKRLLSSVIEDVELIGGNGTQVGVQRRMKWKSGEVRVHRLLEISDQFHTLRWELIESSQPSEVTAQISKLRCYRISDGNSTLVEWSAEYSADASSDLVAYDQKSFLDNLVEMRNKCMGNNIAILYHVHEAPSTRVIWLCGELGVPLDVREVSPTVPSIKLSKSTELPISKGGLVTSFLDYNSDVVILESGAVLTYLIEKYDKYFSLVPQLGTTERTKYHKYFFYIASTVDHLVVDSYKKIFVEGSDAEHEVEENRNQWRHVAVELTKELSKTPYICGSKFTACDIMVGWTLYTAELLGWLQDYDVLKKYFATLSKRPAFQRAFEL